MSNLNFVAAVGLNKSDAYLGDPVNSMSVDDITNDPPSDNENVGEVSNDSMVNIGKSVSFRLPIPADERLNSKVGVNCSLDFAKAVGLQKADGLSFFPLADRAQSCVHIPIALAQEVMNSHRSTLFGYFLGPRLNFHVVEKHVKLVWAKYGCREVMMNNNGIYFFKFNDVGGSNQVVEAGPLMIRGVPLFVSHWDPSKGHTKPIHTTCPLWVKLHNVPLVAFNKEGISRVASALGIPKQMDACTASMCDKAWGRPGFTKVLVETWAVGELKREVQVMVPSLSGGEDAMVSVGVEYLWEPTQCSNCLVFGHKTSSCAKTVFNIAKKKVESTVDDDGFTKVVRKERKQKYSDKGNPSISANPVGITHPVGGQNSVTIGVSAANILSSKEMELLPSLDGGKCSFAQMGGDKRSSRLAGGEHSASSMNNGNGTSRRTETSSRPLFDSVIDAFKARSTVHPAPSNNRFHVLGGDTTDELEECRDMGVNGFSISG